MKSLCEISLNAMGGSFVYKAYPQNLYRMEEVEELFRQAHAEVLRIEEKFTEFHESVITRINDKAGVEASDIDDELLFLLKESKLYFNKSKGIFDPTYASYISSWRESEQSLGFFEKMKLKALVDFNKVKLDEKKKTVFLPYKDQKIGLGGIGKGYAVDRAFEFLKEKGLVNFSVNGSGDMRVHSEPDAPRPWKIGIRNPFAKDKDRQQSAGLVQIQNGSVSTSGSYIQNKGVSHEHHIVSQYKEKERHPVSCTIVGESCMDTDVWATIAMAQDIADSLKMLNDEGLYGILIDRKGQSHLTKKALKNFHRMA